MTLARGQAAFLGEQARRPEVDVAEDVAAILPGPAIGFELLPHMRHEREVPKFDGRRRPVFSRRGFGGSERRDARRDRMIRGRMVQGGAWGSHGESSVTRMGRACRDGRFDEEDLGTNGMEWSLSFSAIDR